MISLRAGSVRWPKLRQIGRITRTRIHKKSGKTSTETLYFITSLAESQASPKQLLHWMRQHWSIENHLHRTKDVLLKEDLCTSRTQNAPHALAQLRNLIVAMCKKQNQSPKIAIENNQINAQNIIKAIMRRK